jgi:hypothetical protein
MTEREAPKLSAKHLSRLKTMVARLEAAEARMQKTFGDRTAGSIRSSDWRDAEALRAAIRSLTSPIGDKP